MVGFDIIAIQKEFLLNAKLKSRVSEYLKMPGRIVLKFTFFSDCTSNLFLNNLKESLVKEVTSVFNEFNLPTPCISVVAQKPLDDSFYSVEVMYFDNYVSKYEITFKEKEYLRYCILVSDADTFLVTSCTPFYSIATEAKAEKIFSQIYLAFKSIEDILVQEGFTFSDVIRQWTYIEDVLGLEEFEDGIKQFYQIYNDVRTSFFETNDFFNGYMAATGIGTFAGIIATEVIAYRKKTKDGYFVTALKNPEQINAYEYSEGKLIGTPMRTFQNKTTPKFERGKLLYKGDSKLLFLSGTSSVLGEDTINQGFTVNQIEITIQNIKQVLLYASQITDLSCCFSFSDFKLLRVYLRYTERFPEIQTLLTTKFPNAKILFLLGNVCRDDLNVEVEGVIYI